MALRLVAGETAREHASKQDSTAKTAATPVERVFWHWVWMLGKAAGRVVLGPSRRRVIERALDMGYGEDTLRLAIDGCAGSRWHAGENDRGQAFDDLELILRDERHIETFAERGERLHQAAERALQAQREEAQAPTVVGGPSPEVAARLAAMRRELAAKAAGRVLR